MPNSFTFHLSTQVFSIKIWKYGRYFVNLPPIRNKTTKIDTQTNMHIETAPAYSHLRTWLSDVPRLMARSEGRLLYKGRNEVRLFLVDGRQVVAKRFKRHGLVKMVAYTLFRPSKARRAYENAMELQRRGFATPAPIAFMEERCCGLVRQVYYVCEHTDAQPIRPRLIEQDPFDQSLATAYARFVAQLHEAGVLHRDLNPTNVLFKEGGGTTSSGRSRPPYTFELIDINRMRFYDGAVPRAECMENLTLFYWLTPAYRYILGEYAAARRWTDEDTAEAIRVKERHDRRWIRRKQITHLGRYEVLH